MPRKLLILLALTLAACGGREARENAALRRELAETQKKLHDANATIASYKAIIETTTKQAASATARVNELESRMARIRELLPQLSSKVTQEITAATAPASSSRFDGPPSRENSDGEWQRLEQEKDERLRKHEEWLTNTIVYTADGVTYHRSPDCRDLFALQPTRHGPPILVYIGHSTTLRAVRDRGMRPHGECGAPDYNAFP